MRVAILGAGDLGATIARRLAEREGARHVVLVDANEGRAKGKALDLLQSGPVEGYDTELAGAAALPEGCDVVIAADPPELEGRSSRDAAAWMAGLVKTLPRGPFVVAGEHGPTLVDAAVRGGIARERVVGSAPLAWAGALRAALGREMGASAADLGLAVLGLPPERLVVPFRGVTVSGLPQEADPSPALRRALEAVRRRSLGPVALATAADRLLAALLGPPGPVLPAWARLEGEFGHRGMALAVPVRLGWGRIQAVVEVPLEPVERVAFDNAAQTREEEG
ncbi:MAG TPA: NAD(P)-binding domain-containing protein [Vicinamibacteria bacterium]